MKNSSTFNSKFIENQYQNNNYAPQIHKVTQHSKSSHQYILNPVKENRNYINSYQVFTI